MTCRHHSAPPFVEVDLVDAGDLDADLISVWEGFQKERSDWKSPFLHPKFIGAVGAVRDDVRVAILKEQGSIVGFFPFQARKRQGRPVGHPVSDFHDVIHRPGLRFDFKDLLRQCGLNSWTFDHAPASQQNLVPYRLATAESPYMDLERGWDAYADSQRKSSGKVFGSTLKKARKIEREVGPLRLEFSETDDAAFGSLLDWKATQQRETGAREVLAEPWIIALVERIREIGADGNQSSSFSGVFSALYAGEELIAAHLGMENEGILHMWIQAYNRDFSKYSPGLIMLTSLGQVCADRGIQRIDLGKGPEEYKKSFQSSVIPLIEGAVDLSFPRRLLRVSQFRTRETIRSSSFYSSVFDAKRLIRRHAPKAFLKLGF